MCGIAGIISLGEQPIDPYAVKRMGDILEHRGPDDAGYAFFVPGEKPVGTGSTYSQFTDPAFRHHNEHLPVFGGDYCRDEFAQHQFALGFAHRRLSILDLSHYGHQPMASPDRRYWIAFNGEIYNFRELRADLEARGQTFRTRTDTEVILRLWELHGPACLPMLDGMFAFAIYDRFQNTVTIARDRFGVKPMYFARREGLLYFGSETKALFAGGLPARIDPAGLVEYCTFQNVLRRETIWQGVHVLEPGEFITVEPGTTLPVTPHRYHEGFPTVDPDAARDEADAAHQVAELFGSAVTRQLVSDVPVGSYLSGGMDSGSIVAVAGRSIPRLHTFTAGFDLTNVNGIEQGFDERKLAEELSYLLQTEHYAVVLHAGDMPAAMDRIAWHMDDPRVGMCHQNWYVAKLASRFVKVCLAGTGGDELFAGYPWRYRPAVRGNGDGDGRIDDQLYAYWHRLLPQDELPGLFAPELRGLTASSRASFDDALHRLPAAPAGIDPVEGRLHRALAFEFRTFLHGLLITDDRISMAHSLETRVPFLDNALADYAWRLSPAIKTRPEAIAANGDGHVDSSDGKRVLRKAMEEYLPKTYVYQQKQGFSPPDENWYRGPSMDYIKSVLLDKRTLERPWFDQDFVAERLHEHFEGRRNHRLLIWSLLSTEWIQRHYADTANVADAAPGAAAGAPPLVVETRVPKPLAAAPRSR